MIMMKRTLIVAAALALVASTSMAASLVTIPPLGTVTSSQITAITNDGAYAVGYGPGGTTDRSFIWNVAAGTQTGPIVAGSYMSTAKGIAYRTVTAGTQLVIGGVQSSSQCAMFTSTDGGATWTRPYATSGTAPGTAGFNTVGGSGDTAWLSWTEGTSSYNVTRIYGDATANGTAMKSSTQAVYVQGMSNTGRSANARKDANGTKQNVYVDFTTDGGTAGQTIFAGLDTTLHGQATAVSGDGTAVFGQSPIAGSGAVNFPYKYNVAGATITALPLLPGSTGSVSVGYVYGASADGRYAVGMDYVGMEKAALWDTVNGTVLDLTTYITDNGLLYDANGGWTGNLRRAYTVGVNALGQPVIGGMGIYYATGSTVALTRGFILTIPEPATLSFLALGGLALLRRRR
jgi:hypothetical protein